eukprot:jgi/Chrzof1/12598/Cz07g00140.t1
MAPKRKAVAKPAAAEAAPAPTREVREVKRRKTTKEFLVPLVAGHCFTFGSNPFGALGLGEDVLEKFRAALVDVNDAAIAQLSCGGMHTVVLAKDGSVYTWGVNDEGALGRPTSGTAWEDTDYSTKEDSSVPGRARLPEGVRVVQVVAGDGFTFALSDEGAIYGWGCFKDDASGKTGFQPGVKVQRLPCKVYEPETIRDRVKKLASGARHVAALTRKGEVLTFGMGGQGQLGRLPEYDNNSYPSLDVLLQPTAVPGLSAAIGNDVADIACGLYSTYAISKRGEVAGWGLNNAGQLAIPEQLCLWEPTYIDEVKGIAAVAGGEHHTLFLTKKGEVLACGAPTYGMLGRSGVDVTAGSSSTCVPQPIDKSDGLAEEHVVAVAAGTNVSACVTKEGNAYLWGSNVNGQMAKGQDEDDNTQPTRLRRHKAFGNRRIVQLSFGGQHGGLIALEAEDTPAAATAAADGAGPSHA